MMMTIHTKCCTAIETAKQKSSKQNCIGPNIGFLNYSKKAQELMLNMPRVQPAPAVLTELAAKDLFHSPLKIRRQKKMCLRFCFIYFKSP
jgi:hypothetical protein